MSTARRPVSRPKPVVYLVRFAVHSFETFIRLHAKGNRFRNGVKRSLEYGNTPPRGYKTCRTNDEPYDTYILPVTVSPLHL